MEISSFVVAKGIVVILSSGIENSCAKEFNEDRVINAQLIILKKNIMGGTLNKLISNRTPYIF
jgi:hypothetical protein